MKKRIKKGFTLVELLVVIAILAILASVTVVGYSAFTQKAKDSVAQQELTQIHNYLYAEDINNDDFAFTSKGIEFAGDYADDTKEEKAAYLAGKLEAGVFAGELSVLVDDEGVVTKLVYEFKLGSNKGGKAEVSVK